MKEYTELPQPRLDSSQIEIIFLQSEIHVDGHHKLAYFFDITQG
jgi:hypothetical protein